MSDTSSILTLEPQETELRRSKGDCWKTPSSVGSRQVPGQYTFTDRRILFRGNGLIEKLRLTFSIPYGDIAAVKPFSINLFIRTGIQVELKNGGVYKLSVMKRDEIMALIQAQMAACS